jgi:two-component system sensor histidine kinase KdpD
MTVTRTSAVARLLMVALPSLAGATFVVCALQDVLGVPNPSAVYLVAVVATAIVSGTTGAVATAVASFLLYNFLFTEPRFTLSMHEPGVWLSVVLLLFVGIVVGQLTAMQRSRAVVARRREHEAQALFAVSRSLAGRTSVEAVLPEIADQLGAETGMEHLRITVGATDAQRRADVIQRAGLYNELQRVTGDAPPKWVRVHQPTARSRRPSDTDVYVVKVDAATDTLGSIWGERSRDAGPPSPDETRLLVAAADQLGQAIAHDLMAANAKAAEVARESDALKSALLQSVSHDLRTPLATIRAAAGTLNTPSNERDRRESVAAIEREVEYLNRLVTNLLDLSRIEAGVLRAARELFELDDAVNSAIERMAPRLGGRRVDNAAGADLVRADPVFLDAAMTNLIENAVRHAPSGTPIRIATDRPAEGVVRLTVEDAGPGVPDDALPRLFDKFYRVPARRSARHGTGIGLAVVRGLVEAMGGQVHARQSSLGGLAIDIDLPLAVAPSELEPALST